MESEIGSIMVPNQTDTISNPVFSVDLSEADFSVDSCQSKHHADGIHHSGPAAYWFESQCLHCKKLARGYRCATFHDWATSTEYRAHLICTSAGGCGGRYPAYLASWVAL